MANWLLLGFVSLVGIFGLLVVLSGVSQLTSWRALAAGGATAVPDPGFAEFEGTARPVDGEGEASLPASGETALAYRYEREEREASTDTDGNTTWRWRTDRTERDGVPFVVESGSGELTVDPAGANLVCEERQERDGDVRHTVQRIDADEETYVAGQVVTAQDHDGTAPTQHVVADTGDSVVSFAGYSPFATPFVISDRGEAGAERQLLVAGAKSLIIGIVVLALVAVGVSVALP